MVYKATKLIQRAMDNTGIKYTTQTGDDYSAVVAKFTVKNGPNVSTLFISKDNDNDVSIRMFELISDVTENKDKLKILVAINSLNKQYRFLNFYLDDDGDVDVSYDLPERIPDEGVGPVCAEIFIRIMGIMDDAYPILMKALWY